MALPFNWFLLHGWMMWAAWTIFAIVQISSTRWLKGTLPGTNIWIHRINGMLIIVITLTFAIWAWRKVGMIINNEHSYFVFPVLFLVVIVAAFGIASRSAMRRAVWNTKCALCIKNTHRVIAYLVLLSAFLAVYYGIYEYRIKPAHPSNFPLEVVQIVLLIFVLLTLELLYLFCVLKDEIPFDGEDAPIISVQEFSARVKQGEQLVILDEYVLDVSWWGDEHPGGKFSISANIGRDVSKYFHGGYSLETIDKLPHHAHSTDARLVVNKLIVARLQGVQEKIMKISDSVAANES